MCSRHRTVPVAPARSGPIAAQKSFALGHACECGCCRRSDALRARGRDFLADPPQETQNCWCCYCYLGLHSVITVPVANSKAANSVMAAVVDIIIGASLEVVLTHGQQWPASETNCHGTTPLRRHSLFWLLFPGAHIRRSRRYRSRIGWWSNVQAAARAWPCSVKGLAKGSHPTKPVTTARV